MPTTQIFRVELTDVLSLGASSEQIENALQEVSRDGMYFSVIEIGDE